LFLLNPDLLVMPYLRKEAILSSRIEGTRISLSEFLLSEVKGTQEDTPDFFEVVNYTHAINFGLKNIHEPITLDLIKEMHKILMEGVRGGDKSPGEFRTEQNWIGPEKCKKQDAIFIPPPPDRINELMQNLVDFMNQDDDLPYLIKCALIHYQFETIHPFRDGNGRIGRLLITWYLCNKKLIKKPLLYISGFFDKNRDGYVDLLLETNQEGRFEEWIKFFLEGIKTQAVDALDRTTKLQELRENYRRGVQGESKDSKTLNLIDRLFMNPYITVNEAKEVLGVTYPTAKRRIDEFMKLGILREFEYALRDRIFVAKDILRIIDL